MVKLLAGLVFRRQVLMRALGAGKQAPPSEPLQVAGARAALQNAGFEGEAVAQIMSLATEYHERVEAADAAEQKLIQLFLSRLPGPLAEQFRDYLTDTVTPRVKIIPAAAQRASPGAAPDGRPWEARSTSLQVGSAADDPWCGDGSCQSSAGEDCSSCPEDCGECPPPGPSCGEIGGSHCSQSGACPDDFDSLGATYDCNPCCKPQPPPAGNLYIYEEYALDASTFSATGVAETDGGRQVRVVVTLVAPDESVMLSCSRCDLPWSKSTARQVILSGSYDAIIDYYYCGDPYPTATVVRRLPLRHSDSCWVFPRLELHLGVNECIYQFVRPPCEATCIPEQGRNSAVRYVFSDVSSCVPVVRYTVPWFREPFRQSAICSPIGNVTAYYADDTGPCSCRDY